MISEDRRKELENEGKLKTGNAVVLKKGKKIEKLNNEVAEIAKKMDQTVEAIQAKNTKIFEKLTESLEALQNRKIDIPRDKELTEIVKKLPETFYNFSYGSHINTSVIIFLFPLLYNLFYFLINVSSLVV